MTVTPELIALEALVRRMDAWVAGAWYISPRDRHPNHDAALEKCAGLVIWLDIKREPVPIAVETIAKVLPAFIYLLGTWEPNLSRRKREMDGIRDALKALAAITPTT